MTELWWLLLLLPIGGYLSWVIADRRREKAANARMMEELRTALTCDPEP